MTTTDDIEWVDDLPPDGRNRTTHGKTARFVEALRSRPGEWAHYPYVGKSPGAAYYVRRRYPEVEWASRYTDIGIDIYGRYIGTPDE